MESLEVFGSTTFRKKAFWGVPLGQVVDENIGNRLFRRFTKVSATMVLSSAFMGACSGVMIRVWANALGKQRYLAST